jgi:hypothetical protein
MTQTVKQFVEDSYQLVSASTPTTPLHGNDMSKGVQFLNQLLNQYSATGLMTTIAKEIVFPLLAGESFKTFGSPTYLPTPDVVQGRLSNMQNAWLELDGVTYPLMIENRNTFYASYKYQPQLGLPRFAIIQNQVDLTQVQFYPGASQGYDVHIYGKFQLPDLTENDTMVSLPTYYILYLQFALAKYLAFYKGRSLAWTQALQDEFMELKKDMESVSSVNLNIETEQESYLNGAWRVRAGV